MRGMSPTSRATRRSRCRITLATGKVTTADEAIPTAAARGLSEENFCFRGVADVDRGDGVDFTRPHVLDRWRGRRPACET